MTPPVSLLQFCENFISRPPPAHPSAQPLFPAPLLCRVSVHCPRGRLCMPASTRRWSSCGRGSGLCITFAFRCGNSPAACLTGHGLRRNSAVGPSLGGFCRFGSDGATAAGLHRPGLTMVWASAWQSFVRHCVAGLGRRTARLGVLRVCTCVLREILRSWNGTSPPFGTTPPFPCAVRVTRCRKSGGIDRVIACWWCQGG